MSSDDLDIKPPTPPSMQSRNKKKGLFSKLFGGKKASDASENTNTDSFSQTFDNIHSELEQNAKTSVDPSEKNDISDTVRDTSNSKNAELEKNREKLGLNQQIPSTDHLYDHLETDAKSSAQNLADQYEKEQAAHESRGERDGPDQTRTEWSSQTAWTPENEDSAGSTTLEDNEQQEETKGSGEGSKKESKVPEELLQINQEEQKKDLEVGKSGDSSWTDGPVREHERESEDKTSTGDSVSSGFAAEAEEKSHPSSPSLVQEEKNTSSSQERTNSSSWIQDDGFEESTGKKDSSFITDSDDGKDSTSTNTSSFTVDPSEQTSEDQTESQATSSFTDDPDDDPDGNKTTANTSSFADDPEEGTSDNHAGSKTTSSFTKDIEEETSSEQEESQAESSFTEDPEEKDEAGEQETAEDGENQTLSSEGSSLTDNPEKKQVAEDDEPPEEKSESSSWVKEEGSDSKDEQFPLTEEPEAIDTQPEEESEQEPSDGDSQAAELKTDLAAEDNQDTAGREADSPSENTALQEDDVSNDSDDDKMNLQEQESAQTRHVENSHAKELEEFEHILKEKEEHLKSFYEKKLEEFRKWEKEQEKRIEQKREEVERMLEQKASGSDSGDPGTLEKLQDEIDMLKKSLRETNNEIEQLEMKGAHDPSSGSSSLVKERGEAADSNNSTAVPASEVQGVEEALKKQDERIHQLCEDYDAEETQLENKMEQADEAAELQTSSAEVSGNDHIEKPMPPEKHGEDNADASEQETVSSEDDEAANKLARIIDECRQQLANGNALKAKEKYQEAREVYLELNISRQEKERRYMELKSLFDQIKIKLLEQEAILTLNDEA